MTKVSFVLAEIYWTLLVFDWFLWWACFIRKFLDRISFYWVINWFGSSFFISFFLICWCFTVWDSGWVKMSWRFRSWLAKIIVGNIAWRYTIFMYVPHIQLTFWNCWVFWKKRSSISSFVVKHLQLSWHDVSVLIRITFTNLYEVVPSVLQVWDHIFARNNLFPFQVFS